jgi:hypothetical protein
MSLKNVLSITLLAAALAACGGDDTRYVDREDPTPVEYMPVDGFVLGFWVMEQQEGCDGPCINDASPYGDPLYVVDQSGEAASPNLESGGAVGRVAVFDGDTRFVTRDTSSLNNTVIGERFTLHLRARTEGTETGPVFSLVSGGGVALTVGLANDRLLVELPAQERRLLTNLEGAGWREIQLASDGERVTLAVGCDVVAEFEAKPGVPVLSAGALGASVGGRNGAYFTGAVDMVRLSRQDEGNLFCDS